MAAELDPDDLLDACGSDMTGEPDRVCADDQVDALVLFADVQFDDPAAVAQAVADYEELFGLPQDEAVAGA